MKRSGQQAPRKALKLDPRDNVIVALFPLQAGETVSYIDPIPAAKTLSIICDVYDLSG